MFYQCFTSVLNVLQLFYKWFTSVLQVFIKCFITVLQVFHRCFTSVSPVIHQCFTSVSQKLHQSCTIVAPLLHQCCTSVHHCFIATTRPPAEFTQNNDSKKLLSLIPVKCNHLSTVVFYQRLSFIKGWLSSVRSRFLSMFILCQRSPSVKDHLSFKVF